MLVSTDTVLRLVPDFPGLRALMKNTVTSSRNSGVGMCVFSRSVMSDPLWPHGLLYTRLFCPCDFPGKNTGVVVCHFLLQEIFLIQGLNSCLLHLMPWQADPLPVSLLGSPDDRVWQVKVDFHNRLPIKGGAFSIWNDFLFKWNLSSVQLLSRV